MSLFDLVPARWRVAFSLFESITAVQAVIDSTHATDRTREQIGAETNVLTVHSPSLINGAESVRGQSRVLSVKRSWV